MEMTLSCWSSFKLKAPVAKQAITLRLLMRRDIAKGINQMTLDRAGLWYDTKVASSITIAIQ